MGKDWRRNNDEFRGFGKDLGGKDSLLEDGEEDLYDTDCRSWNARSLEDPYGEAEEEEEDGDDPLTPWQEEDLSTPLYVAGVAGPLPPGDSLMKGIPMKLWVDDLRPVPDPSWTLCRSVNEALSYLKDAFPLVEEVSLDHDLGDYAHAGGDGYKVVDWMAAEDRWPPRLTVHSANPVGVERILGVVRTYSPYQNRHTGDRSKHL